MGLLLFFVFKNNLEKIERKLEYYNSHTPRLHNLSCFWYFYPMVLGEETGSLKMIGKCSTTETSHLPLKMKQDQIQIFKLWTGSQ